MRAPLVLKKGGDVSITVRPLLKLKRVMKNLM